MVQLEQLKHPKRPIQQMPFSLTSEEEINKFVDMLFKVGDLPPDMMEDTMFNCKTQLNLLRLRGSQ